MKTRFFILILLSITFVSCLEVNLSNMDETIYGSDSSSNTGLGQTRFSVEVLAAINNSGCGCHYSGGAASGLALDDYSSIITRIVPFNPNGSTLINFPSTAAHSSGVDYSTNPELEDIFIEWINDGADNN